MEHPHIIDLHDKLCDLVTTLRDVVSRVEEITESLTAIDEGAQSPHTRNGPVIDRERLTVSWNGSRCSMGYTCASPTAR